jgi:hypothetical protein
MIFALPEAPGNPEPAPDLGVSSIELLDGISIL